VQQLFSEGEVAAAIEATQRLNKDLQGQAMAVSLIDYLCGADLSRMETVLSALIDRTKFAYVPLEYYDLDRQIAPMVQEDLTLHRLFVPFDLVSRTMMVACCNPCNNRKGNRTPDESGMKLARQPRPFSLHTSRHLMRMLGKGEAQWRKYLFY